MVLTTTSPFHVPSLRTEADLAANFLRRFFPSVLRDRERADGSFKIGSRRVSESELIAEARTRGFG